MKNRNINTREFNPKNRKQREQLYARSFMKHNIESRIFTLQKEASNLVMQCLETALDPTPENLLNISDAIGDVETMIEVVKLSIPRLEDSTINLRHEKLVKLHKQTEKNKNISVDAIQSHEQLTETSKRAHIASKEFAKAIPPQKGFKSFIAKIKTKLGM